jgi:hypothetical protein
VTGRISPRPGSRSQNACASSSTSYASAWYGIGLWYAEPPLDVHLTQTPAGGDPSPERAARSVRRQRGSGPAAVYRRCRREREARVAKLGRTGAASLSARSAWSGL